MHNRRREAEKNEWIAKALARAARRKLYYDAVLAASPSIGFQSGDFTAVTLSHTHPERATG